MSDNSDLEFEFTLDDVSGIDKSLQNAELLNAPEELNSQVTNQTVDLKPKEFNTTPTPVIINASIEREIQLDKELENSSAIGSTKREIVQKDNIPWWVWVVIGLVLILCLLFLFGLPQNLAKKYASTKVGYWIATRGNIFNKRSNGKFIIKSRYTTAYGILSEIYDIFVFRPYLFDFQYQSVRRLVRFDCLANTIKLRFADDDDYYYLNYYDYDTNVFNCVTENSPLEYEFRLPTDMEVFYFTNARRINGKD